jgi:hypothetical protein
MIKLGWVCLVFWFLFELLFVSYVGSFLEWLCLFFGVLRGWWWEGCGWLFGFFVMQASFVVKVDQNRHKLLDRVKEEVVMTVQLKRDGRSMA